MASITLENRIQQIKEIFPRKYQDLILTLNSEPEYVKTLKGTRRIFCDISDQFGYKYYLDINNIYASEKMVLNCVNFLKEINILIII